ncbi:CpsD/CapB family tyrosine-protein kinase [Alkalibacterium pelagium]|uniref:Tyrosine-protein kinase CpsD n=1 Tax=Alkalibacterium pelagium TaxID=426702 RepID=A0A1H7HP98_9LACT|nr:CpsD/CapB family tyrosine-protein kinase [Alkalibacterium pelagium]GEN50386.1 tyrosine protein kinase [Alkalibacterium pelagium]SEK52186.1 capsular exopolysaccharide family [Alkalibacterium pelagium]
MAALLRRVRADSRLTKLVVNQNKFTHVSEQFRTIRTNIQHSVNTGKIKSIVITSARDGEGKSFAAANLAVTLAAENKRILLVDADFRKPSIHKIFKVENDRGLTTLLTNPSLQAESLIQIDLENNLFILPSGYIPSNPSELLNSDRMDDLVKELEESYDLIIYDMPPVLSVTDAQIVSGKVDGTIFIISKGYVTEEDVIKAGDLLNIVDANIIGAIINKIERSKRKYVYVPE